MGENDGDVKEGHRHLVAREEESDAVENVKWEPADCEEEKDEGERLG